MDKKTRSNIYCLQESHFRFKDIHRLKVKQVKRQSMQIVMKREQGWLILYQTQQTLSQNCHKGPGWCGSVVDWTPACKLKGRQFNSQSEHMPGFQARSPVGRVQEATDQCISRTPMFLSLSPFPSLSKNK